MSKHTPADLFDELDDEDCVIMWAPIRPPVVVKIESIINQIQSVLTDDLLKPMYRRPSYKRRHPSRLAGHCYVATEALFHLTRRLTDRLQPTYGISNGMTHWWLKEKDGCQVGRTFDPTAEQFDDWTLLKFYCRSVPCGFLTKEPSKRAAEVIRRVKAL